MSRQAMWERVRMAWAMLSGNTPHDTRPGRPRESAPDPPAEASAIEAEGFAEEAVPWLDAVYRFSMRLTKGDEDAAEDLVQETFLRADPRAGIGRGAGVVIRAAHLALALLFAPAALVAQDGWQTDFSKHTVPLDEIVAGGPPKDGIPAIDDPRFISTGEADRWLEDREPVIVLEESGDARAYPYQILIWHEIVNDVVGGRPLVITFCPLCNTALAFDRRHEGRTLDFGVTGMLRHSDMVMYDRQTETWWQQATGEAIVGHFAGDTLDFVAAQTLRWADFKRAHPEGRVLSRETGHDRPYGRNPYAGYDRGGGPIGAFVSRDVDERLPAMERVAAARMGSTSVAYPFSALSERKVVNDTVAGMPVVVFWAPGTASALDERTIAGGRDVGSTGIFRRTVEDDVLRFTAAGDGRFRDEMTGSTWDLTGRAVDGPLRGTRLEPVPHGDYFWFAWAAFQPDTEIRR